MSFSQVGQRSSDYAADIKATIEAEKTLDKALTQNKTVASKESLMQETEENSAMGMTLRISKRLERSEKPVKTEKAQRADESVLVRKDESDGFADSFAQRDGNRQYHMDKNLLSELAQELGEAINENTSLDEMLKLMQEKLGHFDPLTKALLPPDVAEIDKAFEFLLEFTQFKMNRTTGDTKEKLKLIMQHLKEGKEKHFKSNEAAIKTAQNIIGVADGVISETGKSTKEVLTQMRDMINNPLDVQGKRKHYEQNGGYEAMINDAKGFYHVIGENLKRVKISSTESIDLPKLPSLENAELLRLNDETRTLQAATRVPMHCKASTRTVEGYLRRHAHFSIGKELFRAHINFESLSKLFFDIVEERYPSAERIIQLTSRLVDLLHQEEEERLSTEISVLGVIRDMIKQVNPNKIYRSTQHRDDLYLAIIESLEDLEDQEEELLERLGATGEEGGDEGQENPEDEEE